MMDRSFSFGITINASTYCRNSLMPCSAIFALFFASKLNGLVTIPTTSAPSSRPILATTGAPPVPVPPPMPAVTKIMSLPAKCSRISSAFSSAASLPISGLPPAPSPLVDSLPTCNLIDAAFLDKAWASVLAAMKSTPDNPRCIMLLIAFPPPPPTPITRIFAP